MKSITYDDGCENMARTKINEILKTKFYFCQSYHSWKKGSGENTNGFMRAVFA
jgi:IS30 family transposase